MTQSISYVTYEAHINVECRNSVQSIKLSCKYVNKDSEMTVFGVQPEGSDKHAVIHIDKVVQYQARIGVVNSLGSHT